MGASFAHIVLQPQPICSVDIARNVRTQIMNGADLMESLLTPRQLADRTGVPESTLAQWRYLGRGPAYIKAGQHVRYRPADVLAWEEANRHVPA